MAISFIYLILNKTRQSVYVGSTTEVPQRFRRHKSDLTRGIHHNVFLQRAWVKYGPTAFEFRKVEDVAGDRWIAEQFWEDCYRAAGWTIYNIATIGLAPMLGRTTSDETKAKLSAAGKGKNLGKQHTDAARTLMSANRKGKGVGITRSDEWRSKQAVRAKANWTPERQEKMYQARWGNG